MEAPETPSTGSPDVGQTTDSSAEADGAAQPSSVMPSAAEEAGRTAPRRRKLTDEQEREVTRLYTETTTPAPEIARRLGIAESSVYRVAQRHRARRRGRSPAQAQRELEPSVPTPAMEVRQARPEPGTALQATGAIVPVARRPGGPADLGMQKAASGAPRRFRIRFNAEMVLEAMDVRDALRQAEARGIAEITAVSRED